MPQVIGFDLSPNRVEFSKTLGINAFRPEKDVPLVEQIKSRMSGFLPIRVFDTSGHPDGLADAFDIVDKAGHVVTIGKGKRTLGFSPRVDISEMILKETTLHTSWVFTIPEYEELVEMMGAYKFSFNDVVTGRFEFKDGQKAFEQAADLSNSGKTVFVKK